MADFRAIAQIAGEDHLSRVIDQAAGAFGRLESAANRTSGVLGRLGGGILGGVGMAAGMAGIQGMVGALGAVGNAAVGLNGRLEQSRIAFGTMLGSASEAQAFIGQLQKFAAQTPFEFPELVDASKKMLAFGFSSKQVIPLLTAVGDATAAMGSGSEGIDRITRALGQMQAKGRVQAEEMLQLTEAGIPAWDMLAKKIGVDIPTAMEMVTKRQVDSATMIAAFQEGVGQRFGGMMAKQALTFQGAMSTIKDSVQMFIARAATPFFDWLSSVAIALSQWVQTDEFMEWADQAANALKGFGSVLVGFASDARDTLGGIAKAAADSLGWITQAIGGLLGLELDDYAFGWDTFFGAIARGRDLIREPIQDILDALGTVRQVVQGNWRADASIRPLAAAFGAASVAVMGFLRQAMIPLRAAWSWALAHQTEIIAGIRGVGIAFGGLLVARAASEAVRELHLVLTALTSPVGLLLAAGALLSVAWEKDWWNIRERTAQAAQFLQTNVWPAIIAGGQTLLDWWDTSGQQMFVDLRDWMQEKLVDAWTWLTETAWPAIVEAAGLLTAWWQETGRPMFQDLLSWLQEKLQGAFEWLANTAWPAVLRAGDALSRWWQETGQVMWAQLQDWVGNVIPPIMAKLSDEVWPAVSQAADDLSRWIANLVLWFQNTWTEMEKIGVFDDLKAIWDDLAGAAGIVAGGIRDILNPSSELNRILAGDGAGNGLNSNTSTFAGDVKSLTGTLRDLTGALEPVLKAMGELARTLAIIKSITSKPLFGEPLFDVPKWLREHGMDPSAIGLGPAPRWPGAPSTGGILNPTPGAPPVPQPANPPVIVIPLPPGGGIVGPNGEGLPFPLNPASLPPLDASSVQNFWKTVVPYAVNAAMTTGLPANIFAAIAANETGFGKSVVGNNLFGIKSTPDWVAAGGQFVNAATWESVGGVPTPTRANFRVYNSPYESFLDFAQFLRDNPRYSEALQVWDTTHDPILFLRAVHGAGYATDENWSNQVGSLAKTADEFISQIKPPAGAITPGTSGFSAVDLSISQMQRSAQEGIPLAAAKNICGPYAAMLFANAVGRTPTLEEAARLGRKFGWKPNEGMTDAAQFDDFVSAIIEGSGFVASTQAGSLAQMGATASAANLGGGLAAFNTQAHYFVSDAYDELQKLFHVGATGTVMPGGAEWMSIEDIQRVGNGLYEVITLSQQAAQQTTEFGDALQAAAGPGAAAVEELGATAEGAIDPLAAAFENTASAVETLGSSASDALEPMAEAFEGPTEAAATMTEGVLSSVDEFAQQAPETFASATDAITLATDEMSTATVASMDTMAEDSAAAAEKLESLVSRAFDALGGNLDGVMGDMSDNLDDSAGEWDDWSGEVEDAVSDAIKAIRKLSKAGGKSSKVDYGDYEEPAMLSPAGDFYGDADLVFQHGGVIGEPVFGRGLRTGRSYVFGEAGAEVVLPAGLTGGGDIRAELRALYEAITGQPVIVQVDGESLLNVVRRYGVHNGDRNGGSWGVP